MTELPNDLVKIKDIPFGSNFQFTEEHDDFLAGYLFHAKSIEMYKKKASLFSKGKLVFYLVAERAEGFQEDPDVVYIPIEEDSLEYMKFGYSSIDDFWTIAQICCNSSILNDRKGSEKQHAIVVKDSKKKLEKLSASFVEETEENRESFDMIRELIEKIKPTKLLDSRQETLKFHIVNDSNANAFMYPCGDIVINKGLLACCHTKEELLTILSHEIGHFVLGHSLKINGRFFEFHKIIHIVLTFLGYILYYFIVGKFIYLAWLKYTITYISGRWTSSRLHNISYFIAHNRIGPFQRKNEYQADRVAVAILKEMKIDSSVFSTSMMRNSTGAAREYEDCNTHPAFGKRIAKYGLPNLNVISQDYDRVMSWAIYECAYDARYNKYFKTQEYADRYMSVRQDKNPECKSIKAIYKACTAKSKDDFKKALSLFKEAINDGFQINSLEDAQLLVVCNLRTDNFEDAQYYNNLLKTLIEQVKNGENNVAKKSKIDINYYNKIYLQNKVNISKMFNSKK